MNNLIYELFTFSGRYNYTKNILVYFRVTHRSAVELWTHHPRVMRLNPVRACMFCPWARHLSLTCSSQPRCMGTGLLGLLCKRLVTFSLQHCVLRGQAQLSEMETCNSGCTEKCPLAINLLRNWSVLTNTCWNDSGFCTVQSMFSPCALMMRITNGCADMVYTRCYTINKGMMNDLQDQYQTKGIDYQITF